MLATPTISVVIPMYNSKDYIIECLNSLLQQTAKDFEVIIVDDGSSDGSEHIVDQFAETCAYMRVIHQSNAGAIEARKVGDMAACGEYILNVDSDDFLSPNHLEVIIEEIRHRKPDVIVTGYTDYINGDMFKRFQNIPCGYYNKANIEKSIIPNLMSCGKFFNFGIYPTLWSSCIRRELLVQCQQTIEGKYSIGDDLSITYPAILNASSLSVIDATSYVYRIQENSITHVFDKNFSKKIIYLLSHLEKVLPTKTVLKKQFIDYVVFETCILVSNYLGHGLKEQTYSESVQHIKSVLENEIVKNAFNEFHVWKRSMSIKWRIKIFLIKHRWFYIYKFLVN